MIETIGIVASAVVPLFNIPLIVKIRRRRSSSDISLAWTAGVWICALLMLPAGIISSSTAFRLYCIVNFVLFSAVAYCVARYRAGRTRKGNPSPVDA